MASGSEAVAVSSRLGDRVVRDSTRAWFDRVAQGAGDPFLLDGYGRVAEAGGEALLRGMTADLKGKLAPLAGATVLEVGCGAGAITKGLVGDAKWVTAVDFSHPMLLQARRAGLSAPDYVTADASLLPFRAGSFDRVVCYSVFNNFPSLDFAAQVLRELARVARPGGRVLIGQVPNAERKEAWLRDYSARFGGAPPSRARAWLGASKHRVLRGARGVLRLMGRRPPPALALQYYRAEFFRGVAAELRHRCDITPAFNLLQDGNGPAVADYRLDVCITVTSLPAPERS